VRSLDQHVGQAHEGDELDERVRGSAQEDTAAVALRTELEPGESVDRDGNRVDAAHVAYDIGRAELVERGTDPRAEAGEALLRDRPSNRDSDRARRTLHHPYDPVRDENSSLELGSVTCWSSTAVDRAMRSLHADGLSSDNRTSEGERR
jgi:hypothetical protein